MDFLTDINLNNNNITAINDLALGGNIQIGGNEASIAWDATDSILKINGQVRFDTVPYVPLANGSGTLITAEEVLAKDYATMSNLEALCSSVTSSVNNKVNSYLHRSCSNSQTVSGAVTFSGKTTFSTAPTFTNGFELGTGNVGFSGGESITFSADSLDFNSNSISLTASTINSTSPELKISGSLVFDNVPTVTDANGNNSRNLIDEHSITEYMGNYVSSVLPDTSKFFVKSGGEQEINSTTTFKSKVHFNNSCQAAGFIGEWPIFEFKQKYISSGAEYDNGCGAICPPGEYQFPIHTNSKVGDAVSTEIIVGENNVKINNTVDEHGAIFEPEWNYRGGPVALMDNVPVIHTFYNKDDITVDPSQETTVWTEYVKTINPDTKKITEFKFAHTPIMQLSYISGLDGNTREVTYATMSYDRSTSKVEVVFDNAKLIEAGHAPYGKIRVTEYELNVMGRRMPADINELKKWRIY